MGKLIQLPSRDERAARAAVEAPSLKDTEARRLMKIANEIDAVILRNLDEGGIDPKDLAGLLAHRLGTLMRHLDQKTELWDVCEKVLKAQAVID